MTKEEIIGNCGAVEKVPLILYDSHHTLKRK